MLKITLDRNCLISLRNPDGQHEQVRQIIGLHKQGKITASVCAISASEYQTNVTTSPNYNDFQNFLDAINCEFLAEIKPMAYFDISYWDHALWTDESMKTIEQKIHRILFPKIEFDYQRHCESKGLNPTTKPIEKKWLNAKADVQAIWAHINVGNDIFVTQDKNFFKKTKRQRLIELGAKNICMPSEALEVIRRNNV